MIKNFYISFLFCIGFMTTLSAQTQLTFSNGTFKKTVPFAIANFGGQLLDSFSFDVVHAKNASGASVVCDTAINVNGKVALIDRGSCGFVDKCKRAQNSGAIMAIICNNVAGNQLIGMQGFDPSIKIPCIAITQNDCAELKLNLTNLKSQLKYVDLTQDGNVLYSEDFSKGINGWTSRGITNAKDTFTYTKDGSSKGTLSYFFIDAPTKNNGSMIFDADFLTTQGDTLKIPAGAPPYPRHAGELISPIINCSNFTSVTLKFHELYAGLNGTSSISHSIDGGVTWTNPVEVNEDLQPNQVTDDGKFLKIDLPQLVGKSQARFKFIFDGDFYTWIIDDVKLLGKSQFDIAVQPKQFFFPFNFATPVSQIATDTSTFFADLANFGLGAATNLKMRVSVTNSAGTILHRDSITIANLPVNAKDTTFGFPKSFIPGKLPVGVYTLTYSIEGPTGSNDADPTNNKQSQQFLVHADLYSKDDGVGNNSGLRANGDGDYFFGNLYNTSNDWNTNDRFAATEVTFGAFMPAADGTLKGKSATLYLAEILPTVASDFNNFEDKAITDNPAQIKIVGIGSYEFKEAQSESPTLTLQDFSTFNDKVSLKKGTRYLIGVSYKEGLSKAYQFVESDIQYFYIGSLFFANGQWSASPDAPVVRMRIEMSTSTDLIALPESTLKLMPNPTTDFVRAQVNFEKATDVNFTIADISGKVMQFISKKNVSKDSYEFDTRSYAPGTYLLRISTNEGTKTKKFVVQR